MPRIKIAGVQMDIQLGNAAANLRAMRERLSETSRSGATLTVFPECSTTGYCFDSLAEAKTVAQPLQGPNFQAVQQMCAEFQTRAVFGFLELVGDQVFNGLAMVGPAGLIGSYRKIHLPFLGVDRFTTPGDQGLEVIEMSDLRVGLNICYDCSFPESARVLMLRGADLIVLPTNWPPTSGLTADLIPNARALENHLYFMSVNRIGTERGFSFIGKSKICDPRGRSMVFADHANEEILYAEIDPELARQKHLVNIPGVHEVHRMKDRRPDVYGPLSQIENTNS